MNTKQVQLIEDFLMNQDESDRAFYRPIIDVLTRLGYTPKRTASATFGLDFRHPVLNQTIAKFYPHDFRLKYFASPDYSEQFHTSVKNVIEEFHGKYTGCYGCGRCGDDLMGYTYVYKDGRKVFRCGRELNTIPNASIEDLDEIMRLIHVQHEFFQRVQ